MADIFGKDTKYGRSIISTSEEMVLILPGTAASGTDSTNSGTSGFLVQGVTIQYGQSVNRLFEIGSHYTYFVPGRSAGTCQINRIVGNADLATLLGGAGSGMFTAAPETGTKQITLHDNKNGINYKLSGCVVEAYTTATDANGILVTEGVAIQFASLEISGTRTTSAPQVQPTA